MASLTQYCSEEGCDNPREKRSKCRECYETDAWERSPGRVEDFSGAFDEDLRCVVPNCKARRLQSGPLCANHKNVARRYSMSLQEFLDHVTGECSICGSRENLCVDHDHVCCPGLFGCGNCNRGTLCRMCNKGLGLFRDNPEILKKAITYLETAKI